METTFTKAETLKVESRGLRGSLAEEFALPAGKLSGAAETLVKFHGMYQQKDRDRRRPEERHLGPKPFTLMVRGRIPGGRLSAAQWLAWDSVATEYSTEGLRITTRQSLQLHGVLKGNVKPALQAIAAALSTTTGACGDVVRNVMQPPNPRGAARLASLDSVSELLSQHFEVRTRAYAEIFLDGAVQTEPPVEEEPIYGRGYLPRKFKIAVTEAGNNSVDLFTQDLAFAATFDEGGATITGFHVYAGGGMGRTNGDEATFPRLADALGWIPAPALLRVAEAVVTTQRDFGDRLERSQARLKYTIERHGVAWFRAAVESRASVLFTDRLEPEWQTPTHLGWMHRHDGTLALGAHVLSGRLRDSSESALKSAIAELVARYDLEVQLTPEQDIILLGIPAAARGEVERHLALRRVNLSSPTRLYDRALTCVALPMCSKALAEAERIGPELFGAIAAILEAKGLGDRAPTVRVTGCPNGCARPYAAELGLVGQLPGHYALYVGGHVEETRLAFHLADKVPLAKVPGVVERLFILWGHGGDNRERFGDFVQRVPRALLLGAVTDGLAAQTRAEALTALSQTAEG